MVHPPIRVVVSFALPLLAAGGITAMSLATRDAAPEPIAMPIVDEAPSDDAIISPDEDTQDVPFADPPAELSPEQFSFVVRVAGKSYIEIADDEATPRAKAKLVSEDGVETAIAPIQIGDMPLELTSWLNREIIVGGTCHTRVVGFAKIARLTGDPGYAGDDKPWSASSVLAHGAPKLFARLAGCDGTWARAASESPAAVGEKLTDTALVAAARVDLFAGELANQTQAEWRAAKLDGDWRTEVPITALVARHPVTNERWVVLHAKRGGGCGDHEVNILAAYRANDDGTVTRVSAHTVELDSIEQLVDVDGDGTFEVIGTQSWGLDRTFTDLHGNSRSTLPLQFYGCPC